MTVRPKVEIDVPGVLARLHGFQRDAVEHAFHRLYESENTTRRFLVADEVGLGKTLIAKGILAKAIEHLDQQGVERIDVIYVCSNQRIAKQNLRRLNPTRSPILESAERLTLLPLSIDSLENQRLNFVAFTPGTSFDLQSRLGNWKERLLLWALLESHWEVGGTGPLNCFQATVRSTDWWRDRARNFRSENRVCPSLEAAFHRRLNEVVSAQRAERSPTLEDRYRDLCTRFRVARDQWPAADREERNALISDLRSLLARSCIASLQPDVVILDEFQRFKHLLEPGTEAAELAHELFSYADERSSVRVLLLSATPYKMYTLAHEQAEDDHHADFLRTVNFLDPDTQRGERFQGDLAEWRRELFRIQNGPSNRLLELKSEIEGHLRRVMSRTERIGAGAAHDGMLAEVPVPGLALDAHEVEGYVHLERIARELGTPGMLDYWKSAPFPLNLMDDYALKMRLLDRVKRADQGALPGLVDRSRSWLLDWKAVEAYEALEIGNARMRALMAEMERFDAFRLLWVPPTLPYWKLSGPFATAQAEGFTKRLVFSAWAVVPKSIATILSYEAERRAFRFDGVPAENTAQARKRRAPLLRFARTDGRLSGMPVLALLYPSSTLAEVGDLQAQGDAAVACDMSAAQVVQRVAERLRPILAPVLKGSPDSGPVDEAWYWAAPMLLDQRLAPEGTRAFWARARMGPVWSEGQTDPDDEDGGDQSRLFEDHLDEARRVLDGRQGLGRPPEDLTEVLAKLALAGPATVTLRALSGQSPADSAGTIGIRSAAARAAWGFRSLFNRPESMGVVRGTDGSVPYWLGVLEYGTQGCLSSVVDEWVSLLWEMRGLLERPLDFAAREIAEAMVDALALRTATHEVHELEVRSGRVEKLDRALRAHFALRFGAEKTEDEKSTQREGQVQGAFNSPFWPMVLATTSVGQEGLDFHAYCHAVVHWNLPANPVDLEQREGRVNRFKNHAVRKNVAGAHGRAALTPTGLRLWTRLFRLAEEGHEVASSGLIPYWIYPRDEGARIERRVPALALSRDQIRLGSLRRSLAAYRIVFGQPRQDDLIAWLLESRSRTGLEGDLAPLRVDLAPRARSHSKGAHEEDAAHVKHLAT